MVRRNQLHGAMVDVSLAFDNAVSTAAAKEIPIPPLTGPAECYCASI